MNTVPLSNTQRRSMESYLKYGLDQEGRAYLDRRGLGEVATSLGYARVSPGLPPEHPHRKYAGRLVIPSFSARGTVVDLAFRCIGDHPDCGLEGHAKYLFTEGSSKRLYNVAAVMSTSTTLHILEGQLNAATLHACGEAAVGATGADSWKPHYWRLMQGFERVLVWKDGDDKDPKPRADGTTPPKGGDLFVGKVRQHLPQAEVVECPPGYDPNSLFVERGRDAIIALASPSYDGSTEDEVLDETLEGEGAGDDAGGWEPPDIHYDELGDVIPF